VARDDRGSFAAIHPNPYQDGDRLVRAINDLGSRKRLADFHGVHHNVVNRWARELGLDIDALFPPRSPIPSAQGLAEPLVVEDERLLEVLRKLRNEASIEEIADAVDLSPRRVREALERLAEKGYRVSVGAAAVTLERVAPAPREQIHRALFDGDRIRFAVVSDTHLGSKEERLGELHLAYDMIAEEGIERVIHPGDLVCGKGIYTTQVRDVHKHTFDEQVAYAIAEYPARPGIRTTIVSGNHDLEGSFGRDGADPVRAVANARADFDYLGEYSAWIELLNGAYVHVLHPGGGAGYALSYKPQKLCEGYEAGRKPAMLLLGHYHRRGHFEARNIETFLCGTFEGSTNLAKRYGMGAPAVGFWILEATLADDASLVGIKSDWRPFYPGRTAWAA
jgi:DNA-binding Lrp family transcriptional regulator